MAKRNEEKNPQAVAENQAETVQLSDQADSQDAIKAQETGEQSRQEETASDDKSAQTPAPRPEDQKNPDLAADESEAPADKPKLENLSVLADRHRIPAWHQAALLRYMGWQDDKMVTDEDYRKALDELKHRRIGGGRK